MLKQFVWLLAALLALGIIALMIVTPTPGKGPGSGWKSARSIFGDGIK